jgi:inosose dehydratase
MAISYEYNPRLFGILLRLACETRPLRNHTSTAIRKFHPRFRSVGRECLRLLPPSSTGGSSTGFRCFCSLYEGVNVMESRALREMRSRREAVKAMAAIAACGALPSLNLRGAHAERIHTPRGIHFGVQLNAFPIDGKRFQSFLDTLVEIKGIGYQGFESSYRNVNAQFADPAPARRQIEQTGLTFFGIHIFFPDEMYDPATRIAAPSVYEPVAHGGVALGAKHMILSGAPCADQDQLKRKIEGISKAGRFALEAGLTAAYHNHWWEFQSKIGEMEAIYQETDPTLVSFVLDAGHAYHGGADVPAFIRAHSGRIIGMHLRDFKDGHFVSLGQGSFPLAQVAATLKQIGWKGWVENEEEREDHSQSGMKVIAPAHKALMEAFS